MEPRVGELGAVPTVGVVRKALAGSPGVWIVGGAIRDAALGRPVVDVDIAVAGDPKHAARAIATAASGTAFELSAEFATWRAQAPDQSWHVDVAGLRAETIEGDLELRDFTVNALAAPIDALDGPPLDPTGGLADIDRRLLRVTSDRSLAEDPLRILRAARLGAELGFEIDPGTVALARRDAARAGEPAGERQLAELRLLVTGPDPLRGLELLDRLEATAAVLPELDALRGVVQNPNHHLDVLEHTTLVLENLLEVERDLDRYAGPAAAEVRALLAEPLGDDLTRGDALRFAALLHDTGKPATRKEHADGFVSFIGHDRVGAEIVRGACSRLRTSRTLSRHLEAVTLHHLHLGFMTHERPLSLRRLYEYLKLCEPVAADVTMFTVADRLAARGDGPTATPEIISAHLELAQEVLPAALAWHCDGPPRVPIAGDELAAEVGIEPGPQLGGLLAEVEAAVFTGEVTSRDEAVDFARSILSQP